MDAASRSGTARGPGATPLRAGDPERLGRHRIVGRLGSGGMGVVYLAEGPLGEVAVKVVRADLADDDEFRVRFQREVQSSFRLSSGSAGGASGSGARATARLVDFDLTAEQPWFATEFLDAADLHALVADGGPLDAEAQLNLARGLAGGLVALHEAELVHRDLKPTNVLMTADGPKLIDFGISSVAGSARLTSTGQLIGTPAWMAPEQISSGSTGPAADIFAWASVITFAATGRPPFGTGSPSAVALRVLHGHPDVDEQRIAPALLPLIRSCFAVTPDQRPDARTLAAELADAGPATSLTAPAAAPVLPPEPEYRTDPPTATLPAPRPAEAPGPPPGSTASFGGPGPGRRRRWPTVVLVAVLLMVVAGAGLLLATRSGGDDPPAAAATGARDVAYTAGALYFTDGSSIRRSADGQVTTLIDTDTAPDGPGRPSALDAGPNRLYYVDSTSRSVRSVGLDGRPGTIDVPLRDAPVGDRHVVDASGRFVYVLDAGRITRYDLDGGHPQPVAGGGGGGDGPAGDADLGRAVGIEAVPDAAGGEQVYVVEPGALRLVAEGRIGTDRRFTVPTDGTSGFVFDPGSGVLTLPVQGAGQVQAVDRAGGTTTVAGSGDGHTPATSTALGPVVAVNFAPGGFALVERADKGRNRVFRVDVGTGAIAPVPSG